MQTNPRFFSRILLPSLVAVLLFLAAIYLFVIPNYRESLMEGKRETIRELTNTAWSVMHKLDKMIDEDFDTLQAQNEAIIIIRDMRYGPELKDYFWVTDTTPLMIMHPYRPSLNGKDLTNYRDPRGKNFFVDIVNLVEANGDGYIDYKWQWKDDSLTVVPKLSYVKAFKPWGWIVGTGIYIEDVNKEISNLTRKVVWISLFITIIIATIITYLARRNYVAELERQKVQEKLVDSMQKYKKLVEASTDGVLMVMDNEIVYCNPFLVELLGYSQEEFDHHDVHFFENLKKFISIHNLKDQKEKGEIPHKDIAEQKVIKKNGVSVDVIVNRSNFEIEGKHGNIFTIKDVSKHKDVERELDLNMEKFKSIANLMNIGIFRCTLGRQARFVEVNPKALELLGYASQGELKDTQVQALLVAVDERKEVTKAINEGIHIKNRLLRIKRADGTTLPALVSLFPVNDTHGKTIFCDGILIDAYDHLLRSKTFEKESTALQLSANILLQPVKEFLLPAPQCEMDTPVSVAAKIITTTKSDLILVTNEKSAIVGIVTLSDITRRVVATGESVSLPISAVMSSPIIAVTDEDMVMDAFSLMIQHNVSYVVVKSNKNQNHSYISLLKLSELRRDTPEFIINSIKKVNSVSEIASSVKQLPRIVNNLVETGTGIFSAGKLISMISDNVSEKIIKSAVEDLGSPPAPFVFLVLGSEGRREQTLATDQDNAIIFNPYEPSQLEVCRDYFMKLGSKVCISLSKAGYPLCKGGVMAMNKDWCKSLYEWEKSISDWVNTPNPQEILNTSIFFDFRPVYGDFELANSLQNYCLDALKDNNLYIFNLAKSIVGLKPFPIDSSTLSQDNYDIKFPQMLITSIARLWSLKHGLHERNTSERLYALQSIGVISSHQMEEFDQAIRFLTQKRIKNQLKLIKENETPTNHIDLKQFTDIDRIMLKRVISTIIDHISRIGIEHRML